MTEELENILDEIADMLLHIQYLKTDIRYISDQDKPYFKKVVEGSRFFHRAYWNSIKLLIIDLNKLINPKEHFSFRKALNYADTHREKIEWQKEITFNQLEILKNRVQAISDNHLEKIKNLRDKHYAHNDRRKYDYQLPISLKECWEINEELQKIFNTLHWHLRKDMFHIPDFCPEPSEVLMVYKFSLIEDYVMRKGKGNIDPETVKRILSGEEPA